MAHYAFVRLSRGGHAPLAKRIGAPSRRVRSRGSHVGLAPLQKLRHNKYYAAPALTASDPPARYPAQKLGCAPARGLAFAHPPRISGAGRKEKFNPE